MDKQMEAEKAVADELHAQLTFRGLHVGPESARLSIAKALIETISAYRAGGEPVAWRYRSTINKGPSAWSVTQFQQDLKTLEQMPGMEVQPLYLHPAPALWEVLEAAVRAAKLALFVIKKQGVMPNSSWEAGFEKDMAIAEAALASAPETQKDGE